MDRAGFACEECGDKDETLHAHHRYYEKDKAPWEYPDDAYECLCETCHNHVHWLIDELKAQLKTFDIESYQQALGFVIARNQWRFENLDFHPQIQMIAEGFAQFYNLDCSKLLKFIKKHGKINYQQTMKLKNDE